MGGSLTIALSHAAYPDPNLPGPKSREVLESGTAFMDGDPRKACIASENSPRPDNPSSDSSAQNGAGHDELLEIVEKYKDWSDHLYL
jgi:hypothetical protein